MENVHKESDGKSLQLTVSYDVAAEQLAVIDGWVGVTFEAGESGDLIALDISQQEYQFEVPTALEVVTGEIVYLEIADLTGHTPDSTAYSKTAGSGKVALFKATSDQDANDVVTGIFLGVLAS